MGKVLELISGFVTAPGATLTALTMNGTDTRQIRNFGQNSQSFLLNSWALNQAAGIFRIRSPLMHDNVQGISADILIANGRPLMALGSMQRLFSQDTLNIELSGSATGSDIEQAGLLIYYENIEGQNSNLKSWSDIKNNIVNIVNVKNTLTMGTAGSYSGEEAIDADVDLLKANTNYAILGCMTTLQQGSIGWRSADFANFRVGMPGIISDKQLSANWFKNLSIETGLDTIPVFNSANKGNTFIDATNDENASSPIINTILAQLK